MSTTRDPEGRRLRILYAAGEVASEVGPDNVTHRLVAARADVPLGSTTYYFSSLQDLVTAALEQVTETALETLRTWTDELRGGAHVVDTLTRLTADYVARRQRALVEYEIYLGSARRAELHPLARQWIEEVTDAAAERVGQRAAEAAAALVDGIMLRALISDQPVDTELLHWSLSRITEQPDTDEQH